VHDCNVFCAVESFAHALLGTVSPLLVEVAFVSRRRNYRPRYTQVATLQAPVDLQVVRQRTNDPSEVVKRHRCVSVQDVLKHRNRSGQFGEVHKPLGRPQRHSSTSELVRWDALPSVLPVLQDCVMGVFVIHKEQPEGRRIEILQRRSMKLVGRATLNELPGDFRVVKEVRVAELPGVDHEVLGSMNALPHDVRRVREHLATNFDATTGPPIMIEVRPIVTCRSDRTKFTANPLVADSAR